MSRVNEKQKRNDSSFEMIEFLDALEGPKEFGDDMAFTPELARTAFRPQILVIDDDPLFRARIRHIAAERNLPVTVCSTIREVQTMTDTNLFDIAIVDYYLDDLKTYLKGTDIANILESTPVLLISNTERAIEENTPFPQSIRKFVNKKIGINAIFDEAIAVVKKSRGGLQNE